MTGKNIKVLRTNKGWSQDQLAKHANMTSAHIGRIERGEATNCCMSTLQRIAAALGVTVLALMSLPSKEKAR